MEGTEGNDLSNPLFEKDLFGDPGADNGIGGDSLMDDLSFGGDGGLDPPFQEQLENFLESTGVEETIDPPLTATAEEDSNASTITEDQPMQTECVPESGTNDEENITVEKPNETADETKSEVEKDDVEAMETASGEKTEEKEEEVKNEEEDKVEDNKEETVEGMETDGEKVAKVEGEKKESDNDDVKEEVKAESKDTETEDKTASDVKKEEKEEENKEEKEEEKKEQKEEENKEQKEEEKKKQKEGDIDDKKNEKKEPKTEEKEMTKEEKEAIKKAEKMSRELAHHWKAVNKNPTDFTSWSYLLHYVETEAHLPAARKAYTEFFSRYPYCYGYWKKYADLEKKSGNLDKAKEVFEKGLRAIPLSVELWIHYINFTIQTTKDEENRNEIVRRVFEKAIEAAGTDFKSDKLWDMYMKYEREQKDVKRLTYIYDRLIRIPTQLYSHHFEKFKKHLNSQPIKEVISEEEYEKLRQEFLDEIEAELDASLKEDEAATDIPGGDVAPPGLDDGPPGISDDPPGVSNASPGDQPKKSAGGFIKKMKNESDQIKEKVLESRTAIHKETEQEVSKRWAFEESIKRPYFHVKPLEKPQLKNWIEYLDFEIGEGMLERVVILFERCLIACALYEDLWLKYAKFMEPHSTDAVRSVYTRACTIHLPNKLNIVSHWAAFEETQGNYEKAREILENLEKRHPKSIMIALRQINFERRIKCHDRALEVFKKVLANCEKNKKDFNFFSCKLARYYYKILGEFDKAKEILNAALEKDRENVNLYLQLLDLEFQRSPPDEKNVMELFYRVQKSGLDSETKFLFSQRRLEFLLDFGEDVNQLLQVFGENQKMWKSQQLALKKRAALESAATEESAPPEKKSKTDKKASGDSTSTRESTSTTPTQQTPPQPQSYQQSHHMQNRAPPPQHMMPPGPYNQQQGYNYGGWNQYNQPPHGGYNYQQWGGYNQGYY